MSKLISLSQNKHAIVDDADFDWLSQWKWYAQIRGDGRFIARSCIDGKQTQMHRLILDAHPDEQTDHRDQNTLNNQRYNLRKCTGFENVKNRGKIKGSKSQYKGVMIRPWGICARITTNGIRTHLGYFLSEIDAARAYDYAAFNQHGEFARLNFPSETPPQYVAPQPDRRHVWRKERREAERAA